MMEKVITLSPTYDWMCDIDIFRRMLEDGHTEFYWIWAKGNYEYTNTRLYDEFDENSYLIKWVHWDSVGDKEHSACFLVESLSDQREPN